MFVIYSCFTAAYPVTVGMQQTDYTVDEVAGYQLVCVGVLSGEIAGRELTFQYSTASGTASMIIIILSKKTYVSNILFTATSDYVANTGFVTITEDALPQCVSIGIRSDSSSENKECFSFQISSITVAGLSVSPSEAEICINDKKIVSYLKLNFSAGI